MKAESRKFIVWLTWTFIAAITLGIFVIAEVVTKQTPESIADLVKLALKYFFIISCEYLGCNVLQKGIFAAKDVLSEKEEDNAS